MRPMTDSTVPTHAAALSSPSHISASIAHGLEVIYERCGPYDTQSNCPPNAHVACLTQMETFCREIIDHMEFVRSQLRLRLNMASRINQLPADVLLHVFASMPLDELVTATHVCHQWRKLGLETPALWSELIIHGPLLKHVGFLLDRSKASPVDVRLAAGYNSALPAGRAVTSLAPYMGRLRRLTIRPPQFTFIDHGSEFVTVPLELPSELHMQNLYIDWEAHSSRIQIIPPGPYAPACPNFSSLREVTLWRGVEGATFLHWCTQLRQLSLHIPRGLSLKDVVRIVAANPLLHTLSLWFHENRGQPLQLSNFHWDQRSVHPSLRTVELGECNYGDQLTEAWQRSRDHAVLASYFFECFECSAVSDITISFPFGESDHAFYSAVLGQLQDITVFDINVFNLFTNQMSVLAHDNRGHKRQFSVPWVESPLVHALPLLGVLLRALRVSPKDWQALGRQPHPPCFPALEELWLVGGMGVDFAQLRPAAVCPRLRRVALLVGPYAHNMRVRDGSMPITETEWIVLAIAIALRRVSRGPMPRLERLAIAAGHPLRPSETMRCAAPGLPEAIDFCFPPSPAEWRAPGLFDRYVSARGPWSAFPSIAELRPGVD